MRLTLPATVFEAVATKIEDPQRRKQRELKKLKKKEVQTDEITIKDNSIVDQEDKEIQNVPKVAPFSCQMAPKMHDWGIQVRERIL